jgi:hypothetical protein
MSSDVRRELQTVLGYLGGARGAALVSRSLPYAVGQRKLQIAVDSAESCHLLIPVRRAEDARGVWRSRSITVSKRSLESGRDGPETFLDIHCRRFELRDAFVGLAVLLISALDGVSPEAAEQVTIKVLDDWKILFGGGVESNALVGLLGELVLLARLANKGRDAFAAWTGPAGGRHDFRNGATAIEVKTTLSQVGRQVQIHGASQLMIPDGGRLVMAFVRLECVPNGSISLGILSRQLVSTGIDQSSLTDVLKDEGADPSVGTFERDRYEIREICFYEVNDDFPRITLDSFDDQALPAGVTDLSYGLDLSSQTPMSEQLAEKFLDSFLSSVS